jgi:hypothetical protein
VQYEVWFNPEDVLEVLYLAGNPTRGTWFMITN